VENAKGQARESVVILPSSIVILSSDWGESTDWSGLLESAVRDVVAGLMDPFGDSDLIVLASSSITNSSDDSSWSSSAIRE